MASEMAECSAKTPNGSAEVTWDEALHKVMEAAEAVKKAASGSGGDKLPEGLVKALDGLAGGTAASDDHTARELRQRKLSEQHHASIQTKLDKVTRQLNTLAEAQAKTNQILQTLMKKNKTGLATSADSVTVVNGGGGTGVKEEPAAASVAAAPVSEQSANKEPDRDPRQVWSRNLLLAGDGHWQSVKNVVGEPVAVLERDWNLRVMSRQGETLDRLYDKQRAKLLFALPRGVEKIAISIGSKDLLEPSLLTLKENSLEGLRKNNKPILKDKAETLLCMIRYINEKLSGPFKVILILLPPPAPDRHEVFQQWEEIVLEETKEMVESSAGSIRILNLPSVMRMSMVDFKDQDDFLRYWMSKGSEAGLDNQLSEIGCRRLWDMLERTASIRPVPTAASDASCVRCLRNHVGKQCRSLDKACRRCGAVGHLSYVHDVENPELRRAIVLELGDDIFDVSPYAAANAVPAPLGAVKRLKAPENDLQRKLLRLSRNDDGVGGGSVPSSAVVQGPMTQVEQAAFDDWYAS